MDSLRFLRLMVVDCVLLIVCFDYLVFWVECVVVVIGVLSMICVLVVLNLVVMI